MSTRPKANPTVYRIDQLPGGQKRTRVEIGKLGGVTYRLTLVADPYAFQCTAMIEHWWIGVWREVGQVDPSPLSATYSHYPNAKTAAAADEAEQALRYQLLALLEYMRGARAS